MLELSVVMWIFLNLVLTVVIFSIASFFLKGEPSREMKSKFESGIDQNEQGYSPFYMHFFYIAILFLVFDIEIILSVPMIQSTMNQSMWIVFWVIFIFIIFAGLVLETVIDSVEWKE